MSKTPNRTITSCCTHAEAAMTLSFDASDVTGQIAATLENRLLKKGVALQWINESEGPELLVRVVEMDEGNQILRWLLPFIAPATLEVEGRIALGNGAPQPFHYVQRAQVGILGGSARGMMNVCAQRAADKIAKDVWRRLND